MGEKKLDAAAEEMSAFTEQPELSPAAQAEADSFTETLAEQLNELKEAGIHVPEKEAKAKGSFSDGFSGIKQGFTTEADLPAEVQIEADSFTETLAEQLSELKEAGIKVPEKSGASIPLSDGFSGIEQGFNTPAELTPEQELEAESYVVSSKESVEEAKEILKK